MNITSSVDTESISYGTELSESQTTDSTANPFQHEAPQSRNSTASLKVSTLRVTATEDFYSSYDPNVGLHTAAALGSILVVLIIYLFYNIKCKYLCRRAFKYTKARDINGPVFRKQSPSSILDNQANWILVESTLPQLEQLPVVEHNTAVATAQWIENHPAGPLSPESTAGIILKIGTDITHSCEDHWILDNSSPITPCPLAESDTITGSLESPSAMDASNLHYEDMQEELSSQGQSSNSEVDLSVQRFSRCMNNKDCIYRRFQLSPNVTRTHRVIAQVERVAALNRTNSEDSIATNTSEDPLLLSCSKEKEMISSYKFQVPSLLHDSSHKTLNNCKTSIPSANFHMSGGQGDTIHIRTEETKL